MAKTVKVDKGALAKLESDITKKLMKAPPPKVKPPEKKALENISKSLNKIVPGLDKKILKTIASELAKVGKKHSAKPSKDTIPKVKAMGKIKAPGSGIPSVTIPLKKLMLDEKYGTTGKFELKIWADPKNLEKADKGVMLYFTIKKW